MMGFSIHLLGIVNKPDGDMDSLMSTLDHGMWGEGVSAPCKIILIWNFLLVSLHYSM